MKIIGATDRLAERKGIKILIAGPSGIGKTSLLRTVNLASALFLDVESGDLAVTDVPVDTIRPATWFEARDWAAMLGGPNAALPPTVAYSEEHFKAACDRLGDPNQFAKYQTYFVDSVTALGRMCFAWSEQQPEALSERTGKKDLRGVYGLHAREMISMLMQLQRARATSIILVAILERTTDEFNRSQWDIQIEGSKTVRELPGIIDELITYQFVDFGDGKLIRAFVCTSPNPWGYPAKDRSGRLEQFEPPHLGKLLDKVQSVHPAANTAIEQAAK